MIKRILIAILIFYFLLQQADASLFSNCILCHDPQGLLGGRLQVDSSAFAQSVHVNMNVQNVPALFRSSAACWACHDSDGIVIAEEDVMGDRYKNPFDCTACHLQGGEKEGAYGAPLIHNHFAGGKLKAGSNNISSCISCHEIPGMVFNNIDTDTGTFTGDGERENGGNLSYYHYGKKRLDLKRGTAEYCKYCHSRQSEFSLVFQKIENRNILDHSLRFPSPACSECHGNDGSLHSQNLEKPIISDSLCLSCHADGRLTGSKSKHNATINCTTCHGGVHPVTYLQQNGTFGLTPANCPECHELGILNAPVIPPLQHSDNPANGSVFGNYWNTKVEACRYCHGNTLHEEKAFGKTANIQKSRRNGTDFSSFWCSNCHYNTTPVGEYFYNGTAYSPVPPEITNPLFFDHSGIVAPGWSDRVCKNCHGIFLVKNTTVEFVHLVSQSAGGPDCALCHDLGGIAPSKIDFSSFKEGIHKNLNREAASSTPLSEIASKACWACHGDGSEPDLHPANYKTPFRCDDCHVPSPGQNLNFIPNDTLLNVTQHYSNGTSIRTPAAATCYECHNKSEMLIPANDPDSGTGAVFGGANGGSISPSHYGKKREDLRIDASTDCSYCHQNSSTIFAAEMVNTESSIIPNHSLRFVSSPGCTSSQCHNSGLLHSSTLTKPSLTLPDSSFCLACHDNLSIVTTGIKEKHNNKIDCTECHLNTSKDVHPVKYLQPDGTYNTNNSTGVNCIPCHQPGIAKFPTASSIPPLQHSDNTSNGTIWGNYWIPDNTITSCNYCHGDTRHSAAALGRPANWNGGNVVNASISSGNWCASCHRQDYRSDLNNYDDMVNTYLGEGLPVPPEITGNISFGATGNPIYLNHSAAAKNDSSCRVCHGRNFTADTAITAFMHNLTAGVPGGTDCAECHALGAFAPELIDFSAFKESVHGNLNSLATNNTSISELADKACWACHGEGNEPAQHPQRYKNPRRCEDNECHSLSQSFKAPMVYSHFKDADLNDNPENALSYNISTKVTCQACHSNSLIISEENLNASVSHYATRNNLIDSINCIYCHLDEDNAKKWGNATEINKNRTSLIELDRNRNKFTARAGEHLDLGAGYRINVVDVSVKRGSAFIELYKINALVDRGLVNTGQYIYEENRMINNAISKIPVIVLNITGMFLNDNESIIQFDGLRIKRLHYEDRTNVCYLCHFYGSSEKRKYTVIDRRNEYVYYTEVLFNSTDKKEYDQKEALQILANKTPEDAFADIERARRKTLQKGEKWALAENYVLTLEDVAENSDSARFSLAAGGRNYSDVVRRGEKLDFEFRTNYLGYQYRNITIFRANVSEILQPNIVVLEDVFALSPEINKIKDNATISGYNASWLWENNTFLTGRIPASMHSPLLYDGKDGGADCISCHTAESGFGAELGAHSDINRDASSSVAAANKACWACHGDGIEPKWHPAMYKNPRNCVGCHASAENNYSATYIGDEEHKNERCESCHVSNTHNIIVFRLGFIPSVTSVSLLRQENKTIVKAFAVAGYKMKVRDARYYIDSPERKIKMHPADGAFDSQREEIFAEIDTSNLLPGRHVVYVEAMERQDKWGAPASVVFTVESADIRREDNKEENNKLNLGIFILLWILAAFLLRKLFR